MRLKNQNLQIIRFLAALIVLIAHTSLYIHDRLNPNQTVFNIGKLGVLIFFTLSGTIMELNFLEKQTNWFNFLRARVIRVMPLYWVALTVKLCVYLIFPAAIIHSEINSWKVLKSFLLIPDRNLDGTQPILGVAWTLYFEMFFYFAFSVYIYTAHKKIRLNKRGIPTKYTLEILLLGTSCLSILGIKSIYAIYGSVYLIFFYFGVSIARFVKEGKKIFRNHRLGFFASICILITIFQKGDQTISVSITFAYLGICILLIYCALRFPQIGSNHIGYFLSHLGDSSYSLYLFHPIISPFFLTLASFFHFSQNVSALFLLTDILTILVCFLIYGFLEKPLITKLKLKVG